MTATQRCLHYPIVQMQPSPQSPSSYALPQHDAYRVAPESGGVIGVPVGTTRNATW